MVFSSFQRPLSRREEHLSWYNYNGEHFGIVSNNSANLGENQQLINA